MTKAEAISKCMRSMRSVERRWERLLTVAAAIESAQRNRKNPSELVRVANKAKRDLREVIRASNDVLALDKKYGVGLSATAKTQTDRRVTRAQRALRTLEHPRYVSAGARLHSNLVGRTRTAPPSRAARLLEMVRSRLPGRRTERV